MLAVVLISTTCSGDAGPVGPAGAQGPQGPQGPQGTTGPAGMPVARGLAAVTAAGTLIRGVNVASVTRVNTGRYRVSFSVNIGNGFFIATPGQTSTCAAPISVEGDGTAPNSVFVLTGGFIDCAFAVVVF